MSEEMNFAERMKQFNVSMSNNIVNTSSVFNNLADSFNVMAARLQRVEELYNLLYDEIIRINKQIGK